MIALSPMTDLFGDAPISGLSALPDMVSCTEEAALIAAIDRSDLSPFKFQGWMGKRMTRSYGLGYDFDLGGVAIAAPLPAWIEPVRARAARFAGLAPEALTQALLIRYDPGAGIGWHRDRPHYEHVVGLSLGAPATMRFRKRDGSGFARIHVPLAPRAGYHLAGEARLVWEHSIAEMDETRWSITFRSLSAKGTAAVERIRGDGDG